MRGRHIDIVKILQALPAAMEQFEIKKSISKLVDGFHRVQHALGTLDPEKIADEALFVAQQKTMEKVFRAPKDIPNAYASAQAQVFVFAPAYNNLLCTFLQRPTRFVATVEALKALGKAALGEVAGKVFPLGILQALQNISVPHVDREAARFNQAAGVMDRVFELDESLLELAEQAKLAVVAVTALKAEFEREQETFESNVDWLLDLYAGAKRA
ncbi:hypothetical protein [Arvimicrobium flavum]|uniref:hypothetical protein n=1 Tax=Arvimicrobium flavum TaxID=3393320 RepID=UPI00237A6EE7|nr:hypothetical protein [Mesorhizobium shangrilense]